MSSKLRLVVAVVFAAAVALIFVGCGGNGCVGPTCPTPPVVEPPGPEQNTWDTQVVYWRKEVSWEEKVDKNPAAFLNLSTSSESFYDTVYRNAASPEVASFLSDLGQQFDVSPRLPMLKFERKALPVGTHVINVGDVARVQLLGGQPIDGSQMVGDLIWVRARRDTEHKGWVELTPKPYESNWPLARQASFEITRKGTVIAR
jgi:hypothetical protein